MTHWLDQFSNPSVDYRPLPFWSWNDRLDPQILRWQIQEMQKAGLGGYFMHARGGLETEYLSEDWFNCIASGIDEGKKQGMNSWVYDESGWPSGFAGGLVTAHGDQYHGRWLGVEEFNYANHHEENQDILGIYVIGTGYEIIHLESGNQAKDYQAQGQRVIVIRHFPNQDYIDVMNPEAVALFIKYTHEHYYQLFGSEFGKGLKGFFTDEPRLSGSVESDLPWSYLLPDEFSKRYNQDLIAVLPLLFFPGKDHAKIRFQFWQLVSDLFVTNFMKQINDWCEEHNCTLTGHIMMEESIFTQMTTTGGVMPFYEHMGFPGIDWLRRTISSPVVPKQVSSVANQMGRPFVLTESYALSGWNVSFEDLKWITEWQYVNGVNMMCQHLQGYTLRGLRKRDYPPSLFIQQSWWDHYKLYNDYLARLGVVLSQGKQVVDVLVIHPIQSGWVAYDGTKNETVQKLDQDFIDLSEILSGLHIDYHYGDETIMQRHARVDGNRLQVGEISYKVVILPTMLNINADTVKLLQEFISSGGIVLSFGDFPKWCSGEVSEELNQLQISVHNYSLAVEAVEAAMDKLAVARIRIEQADKQVMDIHYQERLIDGTHLYYMVNHHSTETYQTTVTLPQTGKVKKLVAENGQLEDIYHICGEKTTEISLEFLPRQSHLIMISPRENQVATSTPSEYQEVKLGNEWQVKEMDLNSLTLDQCSYRIDGGDWQDPLPVILLMNKLLKLQRTCDVELKFNFMLELDPAKISTLFLVLEDPEIFSIIINGVTVSYQDIGWWKDTSFKKLDIHKFVKLGQNEILLKCEFYQSPKVYHVLFGEGVYETEKNQLTYSMELENLYLVGDFGVVTTSDHEYPENGYSLTDGPFAIVEQPSEVTLGDLTYQGLLFFAGAITIEQDLIVKREPEKRVLLKIERPDAPMIRLFINGKIAENLLWAPYEVDITEYLVPGTNKVGLELFASNRNLLGPHHHIAGEPFNVGPSSFTGEWSWVEKAGETQTTTPAERQQNFWQDEYAFVKFGIKG